MTRKHIDNALIGLGCMLIVASFLVFSSAKMEGQNFRNIVAQIKFLKNTVQTKMAGGVAWFTGQEEEKINAYGLGLTSSNSSARYLYLNKIQIISLDDSLLEFLPDEEVKLSKGSVMVLNPDGKMKVADKDGKSEVVKDGTLYTATDKGLVSKPVQWKKSWIAEGEPYSVVYENDIMTEYFLLAPPMLTIEHAGSSCIGRLEPVEGDVGDVAYEVMSEGRSLPLTGRVVSLPKAQTTIGVRSIAGGVNSVWREIQLPAHCITEEIAKPAYVEDVAFFAVARKKVTLKNATESHKVNVHFDIENESKFEVIGPDIKREAMIQGSFTKEYALSKPGTYSFKLIQDGRILNRLIDIAIAPALKLKNTIFIEQEGQEIIEKKVEPKKEEPAEEEPVIKLKNTIFSEEQN